MFSHPYSLKEVTFPGLQERQDETWTGQVTTSAITTTRGGPMSKGGTSGRELLWFTGGGTALHDNN